MATLIDTLLVSLKLDSGGFANDAKKATTENDKLADSIDALNETLGGVNETLKGTREQQKKAKEQSDSFTKSINNATKALAGLFTTIFMSTGLTKLIEDTARSNDQLNFLSKNLGMNATQVKRWQGAAELSGGSAEGMASSMANLNKSLWDLVTVGDTSILPYFNALNVGVVKSNGELRNLDDILLDVADSLSQMSRPQAYNFAKNMGFDEGTINMLLQGRQEMERQLALQKDIVVSSEQELEISRQLQQQNALVGMQWDGLKTLLGNYLIPYALKLSATVTGFLGYLNKNRDTAIFIFKALGTVIGVTLIPIVLKAATAFVGLFGAIGLLPALLLLLGASLWMLYDDFKKWKEGGESLLGEYWKKWDSTITPILEKLDEFKDWFKESTVGKWFTDQEGNLETWKVALGGFTLWFGGKWAIGILGTLTKVGTGFFRLFGLPGLLVAGAVTAFGLLIKEISDGFDKLDEILDTVGEKTGNIAKAVITLKDLNASKEDKTKALLKAGDGIVPGAGLLSLGVEGITHTFNNTQKLLLSGNSLIPSVGDSRGERNNNPLNMNYVGQKNSVLESGKGARFAKFNTPYDGLSATVNQLLRYYDGKTTGKKLQTVEDIIKTWAPSSDNNDTDGYTKRVASDLGVSPNQVLDLRDPDVMKALMHAMSKVEIEKPLPYPDSLINAAIKGTGDPTANAINNAKGFSSILSKPIVSGFDGGQASNFLSQTNKLQSQPKVVNNKVEANFGDINISTTASTISGNVDDATQVATRQVYQLISPLF
ncbi:TPA: hypothetical protein ACS781_000660 [Providencia alcalifaciens]